MPKRPLSIKPVRAALATEVSTSALGIRRKRWGWGSGSRGFGLSARLFGFSLGNMWRRYKDDAVLLQMIRQVQVATMLNIIFPFFQLARVTVPTID